MTAKKEDKKLVQYIPGVVACAIIAWVGTLLGNRYPSLGAGTFSILLGLLIGNTLLKGGVFQKGTRFCESTLLSYSIVLLGGTISMGAILQLGIHGVGFIALQMLITVVGTIIIGKKLGFSENFSMLMASGNGVCGSTAIGATAPVIGAESRDRAMTITLVNMTGTLLMLLLPVLAAIFFKSQVEQSSAFIGGILQSVGQVVASGSMMGEPIKDLSTIFKIVRILFLVFILLGFTSYKTKTADKSAKNENNEIENKQKSKFPIPWYVTGFFIFCIIFSMGGISDAVSHGMKEVSHVFEIVALAGIGMSVKFSDLKEQGMKALKYCLSIGLLQISMAILLIFLLF